MLRARKNAITTRHQPRADTSGVDALTSSELLKIETALVQKPSASAPADALALGFLCVGGGERDRTDDLLLAKQALSQLSYTPSFTPDLTGGSGWIRTIDPRLIKTVL